MIKTDNKVIEFIEKAKSLQGHDREKEIWKFAGDANKKFRQQVMTVLTGKPVPVSKSGVRAIWLALKRSEREVPAVESSSEPKTRRHELMLEAKNRGIRNFRVLNKTELETVLADGVTPDVIEQIVAGAVTRWKSGWGKRKVAS